MAGAKIVERHRDAQRSRVADGGAVASNDDPKSSKGLPLDVSASRQFTSWPREQGLRHD